MKITVHLSASETKKVTTIDVEQDLFFEVEQWNNLPENEQRELIAEYVDGFDQPYWNIDNVKTQ